MKTKLDYLYEKLQTLKEIGDKKYIKECRDEISKIEKSH